MNIEKGKDLILTENEKIIFENVQQTNPLAKYHNLYPIRIDNNLYVVSDIGFGEFGTMIKYVEEIENKYNAAYWSFVKKYIDLANKHRAEVNKEPISIASFTVIDLTEEEIKEYYAGLNKLPKNQPEDDFIEYKIKNFVIYPDIKDKVSKGSFNFGIAVSIARYIDEVSNLLDLTASEEEATTTEETPTEETPAI